jgi:competence protein ComEC
MTRSNQVIPSFFNRLGGRMLLAFISLLAIWLASYTWSTIGQTSQPHLEVVFIYIEHGDSILLRSSKGDTVLIDAGYPDSGTLNYLNSHNIKHIDTVIATHAHEDHIGGIPEILRAVEVGKIIENGQVIDSPYFIALQKAIQETGVRRETVKSGDRIPFGELTFNVWNPSRVRPDVVNNNSIVLSLVVGEIRFLFTGDIEKPIEARLVNSNLDIKSDILKVAHHAGNTSSDPAFLEKVHPAVAIYSASNDFPGFPNQDTIDNLLLAGAKVYGTNFNGTITLKTDGQEYTISTERGNPLLP